MTETLERVKDALHKHHSTCVLLTADGRVLESSLSGVSPLTEWLRKDPELLRGASIADRVIGKAAALLMLYAGVKEVYADVISEHAAVCLGERCVPFHEGERVPYIVNRTHTGMCPMEKLCLDTNLPREGYERILRKQEEMACQKAERQPGRSRGEQSNGTIAANEKRQPGRDPRRSGGSLIGAFLLAYRMKGRCDK